VFTLYNISLWLHISAAVVGLGATFALSIGYPLALKLDAHYMPFVHHLSMNINRKLASPALLILIATGIYQALDSDTMDEPWVGGTFLIALILGGLQGSYFIPTDRKLAKMAEGELAGGARPGAGAEGRHDRRRQRLPDRARRLPDDGQARLLAGPASASAVSSAAGIGRPIRKPWPKSQPLDCNSR
jgi:hypothetical protein